MAQHYSELRELVHKHGFRLTPQRQIILDAVRQAKGHTTPDEVFARIQAKSSAINRATVYRTLEFLLKVGLVTVAQVRDNQTVYEFAGEHIHHHLVCQKCNKIQEIDHDIVQPLFSHIEHEYDFVVKTNHLMMFGLCADCRSAKD